jgi:hypothetical protein
MDNSSKSQNDMPEGVEDDTAVEKRKLEIVVISAKNLPYMDDGTIGSCDAYCKVFYRDRTVQTGIRYKTLNPEWRESVFMPIDLDKEGVVECQVIDWDTDLHDLVGRITFDIGGKHDPCPILGQSIHRLDQCISMSGTRISKVMEECVFPLFGSDGEQVRGPSGATSLRLRFKHHLEVCVCVCVWCV